MKGEKRERWLRLCVEAANEQDSNRLLELVSEINRLLHEKALQLVVEKAKVKVVEQEVAGGEEKE